MKITKTYL